MPILIQKYCIFALAIVPKQQIKFIFMDSYVPDERKVFLKVKNALCADGRRVGYDVYVSCPVCELSDCIMSFLASGCEVIVSPSLFLDSQYVKADK